jgi:hypothetical protein
VIWPEDEWRVRAGDHAQRADTWITPHLERRRRGIKHPVMDFLFDYYPYSPGRLRTWHPGLGHVLIGEWKPPSNASSYVRVDEGWIVDPQRADRARLSLAIRILSGTQVRAPQHSCFGMHEWAMVYRLPTDAVRHSHESLRLSPESIAQAVDDIGLRCTHIDAYRFFTAEASDMNALVPTRNNQPDLEQPGCIHANMDLFKYAMWFQPYVPGDLVLDCFELAVHAREIDMRASPYNLADAGYPPIAVEIPDGRQEYAKAQREITDLAGPLRMKLLAELDRVAATPVPST